jgi:flagellar hook-associated protein 3 FlgL
MRISNKAVFDTITRNLSSSSEAMYRANRVVSTGRRINNLSDDPVGLVSVLSLRSSLEHIGQLERNINIGNAWLKSGETALARVEDILSQAKVLSIQMSSASVGERERMDGARVAEGFLRQIISLANTKVDGRYIFSGTNTDTEPFVLDDSDPDNRSVSYNGNSTEFSVEISKGIRVGVGGNGEDIFGGGDSEDDCMFKTLTDLEKALENNDVEAVRSAMDLLEGHMDDIRAVTADIGSKMNRLDLKAEIIMDLRLTYLERKSELEDADIAEAIMELKARETAYQAALNSSATVMRLSLVDFL